MSDSLGALCHDDFLRRRELSRELLITELVELADGVEVTKVAQLSFYKRTDTQDRTLQTGLDEEMARRKRVLTDHIILILIEAGDRSLAGSIFRNGATVAVRAEHR